MKGVRKIITPVNRNKGLNEYERKVRAGHVTYGRTPDIAKLVGNNSKSGKIAVKITAKEKGATDFHPQPLDFYGGPGQN
jgi:hypothetical protein